MRRHSRTRRKFTRLIRTFSRLRFTSPTQPLRFRLRAGVILVTVKYSGGCYKAMRNCWPILSVALMAGPAMDLGADVGLIKINGAIGPATASFIARAIDVAASRQNACLV